jgi:hypothetical protein
MPSRLTLYTVDVVKEPFTFLMLLTIMAPVSYVYEETVPSKKFRAEEALMTSTELPVM